MIGVITLHQDRFQLPDGSGQEPITLVPEPDGIDEDNPRLLAKPAADPAADLGADATGAAQPRL